MKLKGRRQSDNIEDHRDFKGKERRKQAHMEIQEAVGGFSSHLRDAVPMAKQALTGRDQIDSIAQVENFGYTGPGEGQAAKLQESQPTQKNLDQGPIKDSNKLEPSKKEFAETPKKAPTPTPRPGQVTPGKWITKGK